MFKSLITRVVNAVSTNIAARKAPYAAYMARQEVLAELAKDDELMEKLYKAVTADMVVNSLK